MSQKDKKPKERKKQPDLNELAHDIVSQATRDKDKPKETKKKTKQD